MSSSTASTQDAEHPPVAPPPAVDPALLSEITAFRDDCTRRYRFNNFWDTVLTVVGILLSVAVVVAGFVDQHALVSAVLGAIIGAVVTAQKAFPFGQRASFYRLLIGQAENLTTQAVQRLWTTQQVVDMLSTLRLDFAQELPRGTGAQDNHTPTQPPSGAAPAAGTPKTPPGPVAAAAPPGPVAAPLVAPAPAQPAATTPPAADTGVPTGPAAFGPDLANLPDGP